jgi:hypothetical protein
LVFKPAIAPLTLTFTLPARIARTARTTPLIFAMMSHTTDVSTYKFNHTMFRIKDPKVSLTWYEKVLGMKVGWRGIGTGTGTPD